MDWSRAGKCVWSLAGQSFPLHTDPADGDDRPGSGCTTFLKTLAGLNSAYAGVDGEVKYNSAVHNELGAAEKQVLFCSEDDVFYAHLKVG